ncbi:MAG: [FeFe] hydrogenase H-cluster radical SAM maturase HydG, partial [Bacteroidales bacterium]|nr:[FeFe] hydrogenase H-cluster radical SAM maturase HydG [Bacteroidales bacterium]
YAIPGFIGRFCTPNAIMTLAEYLKDYAGERTRKEGEALIARELAKMPEDEMKRSLVERLRNLAEDDKRDQLF